MRTLDATLRRSATLTPSEFLRLYSEHPERVKSARMIPPRIGKDKHFGRVRVVFASRHYAECRAFRQPLKTEWIFV